MLSLPASDYYTGGDSVLQRVTLCGSVGPSVHGSVCPAGSGGGYASYWRLFLANDVFNVDYDVIQVW